MNWPLRTRPTRQAGVLLAAVVLVLFGIGGTQNNLLYIVFAILATCTVLGWLGPAFLSRRISLKRNIPASAHEGAEVSLEVDVCNTSRIFRAPAFIVEDANHLAGNKPTPALVDSIAPGGAVRFRLPMTLTRRGKWSLGDMHLVSGFPMGVFEREWRLQDKIDILVYPRVVGVRDRLLEGVAVNPSRSSSTPDTEREIQGLRQYQEGDDLRRINWKATARRDDLVVGEFHKVEKRPRVALYLDISGGTEDSREAAISMAASLAVFYHSRKRLIKMVTARDIITFGRSERKIKAMLELLALLDHEDQVPLKARPRENGQCLKALVHSGHLPPGAHQCDLVIGPRSFGRYAPSLGIRKRNSSPRQDAFQKGGK